MEEEKKVKIIIVKYKIFYMVSYLSYPELSRSRNSETVIKV